MSPTTEDTTLEQVCDACGHVRTDDLTHELCDEAAIGAEAEHEAQQDERQLRHDTWADEVYG